MMTLAAGADMGYFDIRIAECKQAASTLTAKHAAHQREESWLTRSVPNGFSAPSVSTDRLVYNGSFLAEQVFLNAKLHAGRQAGTLGMPRLLKIFRQQNLSRIRSKLALRLRANEFLGLAFACCNTSQVQHDGQARFNCWLRREMVSGDR